MIFVILSCINNVVIAEFLEPDDARISVMGYDLQPISRRRDSSKGISWNLEDP